MIETMLTTAGKNELLTVSFTEQFNSVLCSILEYVSGWQNVKMIHNETQFTVAVAQ